MDSMISWVLIVGAIALVEGFGVKINSTIKLVLRIAYLAVGIGQFLGGSSGTLAKVAGLVDKGVASSGVLPATIDKTVPVNTDDDAPIVPSLVLQADDLGHFHVTASMNFHNVDVLVDTGASFVSLTYADASRLALLPDRSAFNIPMSTANGIVRAAPILIDSIELGQVAVHNVKGVVMPDRALRTSLLGMSFIKKLSNVKMGQGKLELTQ
ncbi:MAG: TIGR02281 family clan AA aspartic protease [Hyphomicrobiales bacterium]|nr:TIGR02281 family clan AA aspartic protease [Hyphomicrobiales bacterium]MDE2115546.1 TIGR02281 family clan AA aspartic protease [Hyphomicrobiales bacterium]